MKPLLDALRGARKIEIFLLIAVLCALLVLCLGSPQADVQDASGEELRLQRILGQIEGAGKVSVMLTDDDGGAQGCVVAAQGAGDISVLLELQRAVRALTGLELDRIEIVQSKH